MKTFFGFFFMIGFAGLLVGCAGKATGLSPTASQAGASSGAAFEALIPLAETFVDQMVRGDFAAATSRFDGPMLSAMPEAKLKATWAQLLAQVGAFKQRTGNRTEQLQGYRIVYITCHFETAALDVRVVFNSQGQISGLQFQPAQVSSPSFEALIPLAKTFVDQLPNGDFAS